MSTAAENEYPLSWLSRWVFVFLFLLFLLGCSLINLGLHSLLPWSPVNWAIDWTIDDEWVIAVATVWLSSIIIDCDQTPAAIQPLVSFHPQTLADSRRVRFRSRDKKNLRISVAKILRGTTSFSHVVIVANVDYSTESCVFRVDYEYAGQLHAVQQLKYTFPSVSNWREQRGKLKFAHCALTTLKLPRSQDQPQSVIIESICCMHYCLNHCKQPKCWW